VSSSRKQRQLDKVFTKEELIKAKQYLGVNACVPIKKETSDRQVQDSCSDDFEQIHEGAKL
jgi:hypothetical protein